MYMWILIYEYTCLYIQLYFHIYVTHIYVHIYMYIHIYMSVGFILARVVQKLAINIFKVCNTLQQTAKHYNTPKHTGMWYGAMLPII